MELVRTRSLVLLVDDSPTQSRRSAEALEVAGFRVRLARNGREALEDARRWRPDVIVSDVLMPVMDGFALCREVRREPALARVPIVLHTMTFLDPRDEEFALGLGATRFVLKPTNPADLVGEVRAALSAGPATANPLASTVEDSDFLQGYNQRLAAKLEEKVAELEDAYTRLEQQSRRNELTSRSTTCSIIRDPMERPTPSMPVRPTGCSLTVPSTASRMRCSGTPTALAFRSSTWARLFSTAARSSALS